MNAIEKALQDVLFSIPREVLHATFIKRGIGAVKYPISLESVIREKVINARVLVDCNLVGGVQMEIPLRNLRPVHVQGVNSVFKIPKTLTEGRDISSVLSVSYGGEDYYGSSSSGSGSSALVSQAMSNLNAVSTGGTPSIETNVRLIGDNTILIVGDYINIGDIVVRCVVGNDAQMSNLNPTAVPAFSELVVMAVKAYIYVNKVIPMDKNQLYGGMTLGSLKDVIDGYSEANELYKEYLRDTWKVISYMDDTESFHRTLNALMP